MTHFAKALVVVAALVAGVTASERAEAFRCGSKIIDEGMHEQKVIGLCGEPTTRRHLGYIVRGHSLRFHRGLEGWSRTRHAGIGHLSEEVALTEFTYNFGPRKLMRRLVFEGGILVRIETIGYGYREK